jgi:hypothetical protein
MDDSSGTTRGRAGDTGRAVPGRRRRRLGALVVVLTMVLTMVPASPAGAYKVSASKGRPGKLLTVYQVQGSHFDLCGGMPYQCFSPWLHNPGLVVERSPATKARQEVRATYQIQRWNGSQWVHQTSQTPRVSVPKGVRRVQLPAMSVFPTGGKGWLRASRVKVQWLNGKGKPLGHRIIRFAHAGDYVCATRFPCEVGRGAVWLGPSV